MSKARLSFHGRIRALQGARRMRGLLDEMEGGRPVGSKQLSEPLPVLLKRHHQESDLPQLWDHNLQGWGLHAYALSEM